MLAYFIFYLHRTVTLQKYSGNDSFDEQLAFDKIKYFNIMVNKCL